MWLQSALIQKICLLRDCLSSKAASATVSLWIVVNICDAFLKKFFFFLFSLCLSFSLSLCLSLSLSVSLSLSLSLAPQQLLGSWFIPHNDGIQRYLIKMHSLLEGGIYTALQGRLMKNVTYVRWRPSPVSACFPFYSPQWGILYFIAHNLLIFSFSPFFYTGRMLCVYCVGCED